MRVSLRVASVGLTLLLTGSTAQAAVITVSSFTANALATPGQWGISDLRPGGTASIVDLTGMGGNLENNQPLPIGAAYLATINNAAKAEVGLFNSYGTFGSIVNDIELAYEFNKVGFVGTTPATAPSMKIGLFNGTTLGYLVYEAYLNPLGSPPTPDVWTQESMDANTGAWWWTGHFGPSSTIGGPYQTLSQLASNPALAGADMVYVGMGLGSGNGASQGYFDEVTINAGSVNNTYDFMGPAAVPEPSSIALLSIAGLGLLARRRRRNGAELADAK